MHFIVVANDAALSIREFFLQDEVLLDLYPLGDGRSLDLGTRCFLAVELHRLLIHRNDYRVRAFHHGGHAFRARVPLPWFFSLPSRRKVAILQLDRSLVQSK